MTPRWSQWAQDLPRQVRGHVAPETPCWPWEQPSPFLPQIRRPWGFRQLYFSYLVSLVQALLSVVQLLVQVALLFTEQLLKRKRTRVWAWRSRPGARAAGPRGQVHTNLLALQVHHPLLQGRLRLFNLLEPLDTNGRHSGVAAQLAEPGRQPGGLALPALPSLPPGGELSPRGSQGRAGVMGSVCPACGPGPGAPAQPRLVSGESAPQRRERRDVRRPVLPGCWPLSSHLLDTPARPAGGRWEGALPAGPRVLAAGAGPGAGWRPVGAERLEGGEPGWAGRPRRRVPAGETDAADLQTHHTSRPLGGGGGRVALGRGLAESTTCRHAWQCWLTCACARPPRQTGSVDPNPTSR